MAKRISKTEDLSAAFNASTVDAEISLGFTIRTGGNKPLKVFGAFGFRHETAISDEDPEDESGVPTKTGDHKKAEGWAKKQNEQARLMELPYLFAAHIPATKEEYKELYAAYLASFKQSRALYA